MALWPRVFMTCSMSLVLETRRRVSLAKRHDSFGTKALL